MDFFVPLLIFLALVWAALGVLLAKWLKQSGRARPFKGKAWRDSELYGAGVGVGRVKGMGESSSGLGGVGERKGVLEFGRGRVKGF